MRWVHGDMRTFSFDEAFRDVRGMRRLAGSPADIAARLRREIRARVGLPVTVGVARTKFLAKVASGVAKPDGLLVVPPDRELAFLHALPVERLWGVGAVTADKHRGIRQYLWAQDDRTLLLAAARLVLAGPISDGRRGELVDGRAVHIGLSRVPST